MHFSIKFFSTKLLSFAVQKYTECLVFFLLFMYVHDANTEVSDVTSTSLRCILSDPRRVSHIYFIEKKLFESAFQSNIHIYPFNLLTFIVRNRHHSTLTDKGRLREDALRFWAK